MCTEYNSGNVSRHGRKKLICSVESRTMVYGLCERSVLLGSLEVLGCCPKRNGRRSGTLKLLPG